MKSPLVSLSTRILIPLVTLAVFVAVALFVRLNPPETERREPSSEPLITVEAQELTPIDYDIALESYGTVRPRTQSVLVSQVGGQIVTISPELRDGGFFEKGDVLLSIDPRDYEANAKIAQAGLMEARQALAEEQARSAQALENWQRLGNDGEISDLVLRKPQLQAAQARVISAESTLAKAELELERTRIIAPFAGRVLNKLVDVGQVVSNNTQLAEIYATDYVEIRLPLRNGDLDFITLPESDRYSDPQASQFGQVTLHSELGGNQAWKGRIVRTEGAIDTNSRQLHVVAQVDDPFRTNAEGALPLKIGQYVTAQLKGKTLEDVIVIPNKAIYQGSFVYLVENGLLQRKTIEIAWQNERDAIISAGLKPGDLLVLTPLGQVTSGLKVTVAHSESRLTQTDIKPGEAS